MSVTDKVKDVDQPFRVVTNLGTLVRGYATMEEAEQSVPDRNARAKELGIQTTYEAKAA